MRDDDRQRVAVLRAHVDEMNVETVDLGDELRRRVEPGLDPAPIVVRLPVLRELAHCRKLHALRGVGDCLALGPLRRPDAPSQIDEAGLRHMHAQRADGRAAGWIAGRAGDPDAWRALAGKGEFAQGPAGDGCRCRTHGIADKAAARWRLGKCIV
ncbi:hypothetical protein D3C87_1481760 [compost metagenome]